MSCNPNCDTVQIIEPNDDLLVDTAGQNSDFDERGELPLTAGQLNASVLFQVQKLNAAYQFEYLYVDALGNAKPGGIQVIPVTRGTTGFTVVFAGTPIEVGYVLHWRVVIRRTSTLVQIDAPENLYLPIPRSSTMGITFVNPRSGVDYGFSELRVENLVDPVENQAIIRVQVYSKSIDGFIVAVNPRPPTNNYFLKVRTP
jgi:hypothetical protein